MARLLLLDTGVLGMFTHPRPNQQFQGWFQKTAQSGAQFLVPEICDYELRRELIRGGFDRSIKRLDELKQLLGYVPIQTVMMLRAVELWAKARNEGYPTAADDSLDGDVILAAQAHTLESEADQVEIVTDNVGHHSRFAHARRWTDISS
jgi:predicted nucleic acid-binding protein